MDSPVIVQRLDSVAILTLNRPERLNALNQALLDGLSEILYDLEADTSIRVLILTGQGEKSFSAGADLKDRADMTERQTRRFLRSIRNTFRQLEDFPRPTIAAINGLAYGGGCELALSCDIRVMAESATIGLTETRLAIIPGAGGTQRLPRLIGKGKAKELIFTGRRLSAREAQAIGLCERVAGDSDLIKACAQLASEMCEAGPMALVQAKYAINKGYEVDLGTALEFESQAYEVVLASEDRNEALRAFREKRKPVFHGR